MRSYEVLHRLGQLVFVGQLQSVGHVADDDLCALLQWEAVVRVHPRLVLGEEHRVLQFADVVIQGARTHQLALGHQVVGHLGSQIGHLHAVLEGARCLL